MTTPAQAVTEKRKCVFVVDDHPIFRRGLAALIDAEPDLHVCGEASTGALALEGLRKVDPHAAVIDVSMPGASGLDLLKEIRAEHPDLPVLMLSAHDEQLYALRGLRAGASGYLMKRDSDDKFIDALRKVLAGQVYVSPAFGEQLIYKVARGEQEGTGTPLEVLTERELEILQLVGASRSSREIAEALDLSVKTVESHRLHIKEKLNLANATELVRFAVDWVAQQKA